MFKSLTSITFCLLYSFSLLSQEAFEILPPEQIKTITFNDDSNQIGFPVIRLGNSFSIEFDVLNGYEDDYYYINRYTGEILGNGPKGVKGFFSDMRSLHRWLLMEGESRGTARMFTGAANLMFLFIVLSGMYLWIPKVINKENIKKVIFFRKTKLF